jgi:hypothetical protein
MQGLPLENIVFYIFLMIVDLLVLKKNVNFVWLLNTCDMPLNDEFGSYTTNKVAMEFVCAIP